MRRSTPWFHPIPFQSWWARIGAFLFSGIFLFGGLLCFYEMTLKPASLWLQARDWEPAMATIESSRLTAGTGSKGARVYAIDVQYSWNWQGRSFRGNRHGFRDGKTNIGVERMRAEVARMAPGTTMQCWVNPSNPAEAVLNRSLPGASVIGVFFSLPFLTVGVLGVGWSLFGPGLIRRGRRRKVDALRRMRDHGLLAWPWKTGPEEALDSEEFRLIFARAERLAMAGGVTAFNFFWNGIVAVFVLIAIVEATSGWGWGSLGLSLFLTPFVFFGTGMAWFALVTWRNALRPDWVAVIHPLPDHQPVRCVLSFAARQSGPVVPWNFQRLRFVAMAAPWDTQNNRPARSPVSFLFNSRRRPRVAEPGEPAKKEHELTSIEVPVPTPGTPINVDVPAMPDVRDGSKKKWGRWWTLEIEHSDGRLENFEISIS